MSTAVIRRNTHEDKSESFDVLLSDDGSNIEINCDDEEHAQDLCALLKRAAFDVAPAILDFRY